MILNDIKISQEKVDNMMAPMEGDLIALFKLQEEAVNVLLNKSIKLEWRPEKFISEVEKLFTENVEESVTKGKPLPVGTKRERSDGKVYVKQPNGSWEVESESKEPEKEPKEISLRNIEQRRNEARAIENKDFYKKKSNLDSEGFINSLNNEEKNAVKGYTINSLFINSFLRKNPRMEDLEDNFKKELMGKTELLDKSMSKASLKEDTIAYRYFDKNVGDVSFLDKLSKEDLFQDNGFCSTTIDIHRVSGRKIIAEIFVPKGFKAIPSWSISKYPGEEELILNRGTKFKYTGKNEEGVYLLEVVA